MSLSFTLVGSCIIGIIFIIGNYIKTNNVKKNGEVFSAEIQNIEEAIDTAFGKKGRAYDAKVYIFTLFVASLNTTMRMQVKPYHHRKLKDAFYTDLYRIPAENGNGNGNDGYNYYLGVDVMSYPLWLTVLGCLILAAFGALGVLRAYYIIAAM
jgi:hypothetical protein